MNKENLPTSFNFICTCGRAQKHHEIDNEARTQDAKLR